nr:protein kinase [Planctomycetota bacterium]
MTGDNRTISSAEKTVVEDPRVERSRTISSGRARARMGVQESLSLYGQSLEAILAGYGFSFPNRDEVRFEVEGNLGSGANGEVYAVIDRSLKRPVAAKVFTRCSPDNSEEVAQFVDEARITASLQHPNVLPVYDLALSKEGRVYFTMKRIDGRSLGDAINRSTSAARSEPIATFNAVVGIFKDVANALSYAHHRGVLHLDVKPDNIMLGSFGETLLVDWGSALRIDAAKPGSSGTPLFMSPEQARREVSDPRCDVYALGATLFTALTLRCPTWADDSEEFWRKKRAGTIDPPTQEERARIPPALLDIALKALAPSRTDRYSDMRSLLTDLESYQAGLAVSAHRETVFQRLRRWHRKRAPVLWSSVAAVAAILALGTLLYGEKLKEVATWGNPVVVEDFSAPALGPHWKTESGAFAVRDGRLVSETTLENVLAHERVFQGDVAIEYDAEMLAGTNAGDCSLMWRRGPADIGKAAGARGQPLIAPREAGDSYYIQFGGAAGTTNTIKTEKGRILSTSTFEGRTGVVYRVRIEIVDTRISLMIDGRTVCECIEPFPVTGGTFSLYAYDVGKCFDRIRVFTQGVPRKIPPTAIGDAYVRDGLYPLAIERYADVVRSFPGQDIADEAIYKTGLCQWRSGDHAAAMISWRPLAAGDWADLVRLHELEDQFEAEQDQQVREGLLHLITKDRREDLRSRAILLWADFTSRLTAKARITGGLERLEVYLDMHDRSFAQRPEGDRAAAGALLVLRRPGEVLERYPEQVQVAVQALIHLGRPEEALVRYPTPLVK